MDLTHELPLIATISVGLGIAFIAGFAAMRLGLPPLVGYLVAGVLVGPFTPGFVVDSEIARELAEIGVILLIFGVDTHSHRPRRHAGSDAGRGTRSGAGWRRASSDAWRGLIACRRSNR